MVHFDTNWAKSCETHLKHAWCENPLLPEFKIF